METRRSTRKRKEPAQESFKINVLQIKKIKEEPVESNIAEVKKNGDQGDIFDITDGMSVLKEEIESDLEQISDPMNITDFEKVSETELVKGRSQNSGVYKEISDGVVSVSASNKSELPKPLKPVCIKMCRKDISEFSDERIFKCTFCPQRFRDRSMLLAHSRKHNGFRPLICTRCGKYFRDKPALDSHMNEHEVKPEMKLE